MGDRLIELIEEAHEFWLRYVDECAFNQTPLSFAFDRMIARRKERGLDPVWNSALRGGLGTITIKFRSPIMTKIGIYKEKDYERMYCRNNIDPGPYGSRHVRLVLARGASKR